MAKKAKRSENIAKSVREKGVGKDGGSGSGGGRISAGEMAEKLIAREDFILTKHPHVAKDIASLEKEIRIRLSRLRGEIEKLPQEDAELIEILTISRLQKAIEDTLGAEH